MTLQHQMILVDLEDQPKALISLSIQKERFGDTL